MLDGPRAKMLGYELLGVQRGAAVGWRRTGTLYGASASLAIQLVTVAFGGCVTQHSEMAANKGGTDHTKCRRCEYMLPHGPHCAAAVPSPAAPVRRSGASSMFGAPSCVQAHIPRTRSDRI